MHDIVGRLIERFALRPHPEGGWFREVFRSTVMVEHPHVAGRAARSGGTFIYYLLDATQFSAFHRVRVSDEIWHLYAGGPLELHTIDRDDRYAMRLLTTDLSGEPAAVVPAGCWQAARVAPGSGWAFAGCTVAPGFDFADFEMPPGGDLIDSHPSHESIIRSLTRR
jgi:predicted cupin superfamily sugar epimerase